MKKSYKIKLVAIAILVAGLIGNVNAINLNPKTTVVVSNETDNWVEAQNKNGIQVFFKESTGTDGVTLLNIKFVNSTSELININWSVSKNSKSITESFKNTIKPQSSFETNTNEILIPINRVESFKDFSITLKAK